LRDILHCISLFKWGLSKLNSIIIY
jgi:hypothetical protein